MKQFNYKEYEKENNVDFKELLYSLHWDDEMPMKTMSKLIGCSRSAVTRWMLKWKIPYRNISQDNHRRYKHMSDEEIKEQTKAANKRCREIVKTGNWILCGDHIQRPSGEDCPAYKYGLSKTRGYKNAYSAKYRIRKLNQTPDNANLTTIQLYYSICAYLNEPCEKPMWHVDHIQPISKGGLHHEDNLQILTAQVNLEKSDKWPLTDDEVVKYKGIRI